MEEPALPSDDDKDVYEPLDMADTKLIFLCDSGRKGWWWWAVSWPPVGISTMERKGGSWVVEVVVV
jgi:hypothetical protein